MLRLNSQFNLQKIYFINKYKYYTFSTILIYVQMYNYVSLYLNEEIYYF